MLDAGCGTGAVVRWLAEKTDRSNPITGVDINPFLLREAEVLRDKAKLADIIEFIECDVLDLPFSDNSFDATFSTTMLEEVDADTAIAEIVRVTKPGGRIGSIVRAVDMVPIFGTVLPEGIMTKVQSTLQSIGANPNGCADISLYKKFSDAGLTDLRMLPQYDLSGHLRTALVELLKSKLNESELKIWNKKVGSAVDKGFFFIGLPMHVAVGTKK
jgi:SAM-dependent methyltransferase